jgi:hypothetical protein
MASTPVQAQSPISLNIGGKHLMIPLSALYFDDKGVLKADRWPLYTANAASVDPFLKRLVKQGMLKAGATPAAKPAFSATSITTGATGLLTEIEISNVAPNAAVPADSKAKFKVTETHTHTNLKPADSKDVIGAAAGGGSRPGLVFVSSAGVPELPKAGNYPLTGDPGTVAIPKAAGAGDAFTLQSRAGGPDASLTSVEVTDVNAAAGTFTLIVKWTKSANALKMTDLPATFAYVLTIAAPAGGFLAPVAGKSTLAAGSDAVSVKAVAPSATILAQ